jgi:hypothetical protein
MRYILGKHIYKIFQGQRAIIGEEFLFDAAQEIVIDQSHHIYVPTSVNQLVLGGFAGLPAASSALLIAAEATGPATASGHAATPVVIRRDGRRFRLQQTERWGALDPAASLSVESVSTSRVASIIALVRRYLHAMSEI